MIEAGPENISVFRSPAGHLLKMRHFSPFGNKKIRNYGNRIKITLPFIAISS